MSAATQTRAEPAIRLQKMLIGCDWVEALSGEAFAVDDPSRRAPIARVPRSGGADVDRAVKAASAAFPAWSRTAPRDRGRLLLKIAEDL